MGRRTRTLIPTVHKLLLPKTIPPAIVQSELTQRQKYHYDKHLRTLSPLVKGQLVYFQIDKTWLPATVTDISTSPRSPRMKDTHTEEIANIFDLHRLTAKDPCGQTMMMIILMKRKERNCQNRSRHRETIMNRDSTTSQQTTRCTLCRLQRQTVRPNTYAPTRQYYANRAI